MQREVLNLSYIGIQEAENLIRTYKPMLALLESLQLDLTKLYLDGMMESEDDVIYSLSMGNRRLDGMPLPPIGKSDKTGNIAIAYRHAIANANRGKMRAITREIIDISAVVEKVDIGFHAMTTLQRGILEDLYVEGFSWASVCRNRGVNEWEGKRLRRKSLEVMAKTSRITMEEYGAMQEKLKGG